MRRLSQRKSAGKERGLTDSLKHSDALKFLTPPMVYYAPLSPGSVNVQLERPNS